MDDRELLELAAKAAGYDVGWNDQWAAFQHRNPTPDQRGHYRHAWAPLEDDGDALRLAVKLELFFAHPEFVWSMGVEHSKGADIYEATRRAIVSAAAEIERDK